MSDSTTEVMANAHSAFWSSNFQECASFLESEQAEGSDIRAIHNKAVASFGLTKNLDVLLQSFLSLCGTQYMQSFSESKEAANNTADHNEKYCCLFNIASIYFQQKQEMETTKQILLFLYSKRGLTGGLFTLKVCFLLLEVLLFLRVAAAKSNNQDMLVMDMVQDGGRGVSLDELLNTVIQSAESVDVMAAASSPDVSTLKTIMKHISSFLLYLYKCRVCIVTDAHKQAKKEIKNALEVFQREIRKHSESDVTRAYKCFHNLMPLTTPYDGRLDAVAADRSERICIMDRLNQMALYLKAFLEYHREHYVKAMKILTSSQHCPTLPPHSSGPVLLQNNSLAYLNNMGCLYTKLERYSAAVPFFHKAICKLEAMLSTAASSSLSSSSSSQVGPTSATAASTSEEIPLSAVDVTEMQVSLLHQNKLSIYYNCGLALLFSRRPLEAFVCFMNSFGDEGREINQNNSRTETAMEAKVQHPHRPLSLALTHIRLGDCCIMHNTSDVSLTEHSSRLVQLSDGAFRRLGIINTGQDENTSSPDTPTLRTAVCHFASALQQLKHERPVTLATTTTSVAGEMVTKKDSECEEGLQTDPSPNSAEQAPQLPTALSMREMEEYAALALAYVNLKLEDWVCAQFTLRKLLKTSMTSEHARYLAQNYFAEALCALGRYDEAYEVLDIQLVIPSPMQAERGTQKQTETQRSGSAWGGVNGLEQCHVRPELMEEVARNTNRAVVWALLGRLADAQIILQSILSECPTFSPAIRCLVYTLLRLGKRSEARTLLTSMNVSPQPLSL